MTKRLEDTCVPRLLGACRRRRLSGILTLRRPTAVRHVYFENGAVVYAASEVVAERFGERLCTLGCISPEQLAQAVAAAKNGKRLGACLVELGYLTASDLQAMLVGHVTYLVHSLFDWTTGEYQFQSQHVKVDGFGQTLSPVGLIFDGVRSLPDLNLIRRWLGDPRRILQPAASAQSHLDGVTLTPEEGFVLSRLDAPLSVAEVCRAVPLPEEQVLRALCAFTLSEIVRFADDQSPPLLEPAAKPATPATGEIDAARAAELCFELEEKIRVLESGGTHYQVLGVNRRFTPEELKKTYRELAKKFHPDRHSQLAAFDFQVKAELERVFIAVQQAYEVLSDDEKRRKYDAALGASSPRATPGGSRFPTGAYPAARPTPPSPSAVRASSGDAPKPPSPPSRPAPPAAAPRPPVPPPSAAKTGFPAPPTLKRPPQPTAGLSTPPAPPSPPKPPSAPLRPPTGAYPRLGDAAPPTPPSPPPTPPSMPPRPATGAYPRLGETAPPAPNHAASRMPTGAYPKPAQPAPPETPSIPAAELYLRTVEYMGNGDVERAYQSIRRALEQKPNNADYHALLARVLLRMPGRNKEAEKAFLTAIDLCRDPEEVPELLMELSDLYLKFGLESRAVECLDRGLELAPEHEELRKRREAMAAKRPSSTPRRTESLRVATGKRLQALVGKVFGLDNGQDGDKTP